MPFKVRCKLIEFIGDEERFPCHFNYKIGDGFTYDGAKFEGDICPGLLFNMIPVLWAVMYFGSRGVERIIFRYSGLSAKDPSRKKYDGIGFRPLKEPPAGAEPRYLAAMPPERPTSLEKGWGFACGDCRTSAFFVCEPIGLANGGDSLPYYNREMSILEKIKSESGMTADEILNKFSEWEREEIYPPLTPVNVQLMLDELAEVDYIELRDGKAYPKNPPA